MADIFGREGANFGGAFAADSAKIVFGAVSAVTGVGLLTQNVGVQYSQQVSRLYEIGTNSTYLVAGRAQGSASLGRVLGPRPVVVEFYTTYGNVCKAAGNVLSFTCQAGCDQAVGGQMAFTLANSVIVAIGMNVAAQDMIINEQLQIMFVALNMGAGSA